MNKILFLLVAVVVTLFIGLLFNPHSESYTKQIDGVRGSYAEIVEARSEQGKPTTTAFPPVPYMFRKTGFKSLARPSAQHWLGVDESTRDVAVRLLYGTRISLTIGVIAVAIYVTIGII